MPASRRFRLTILREEWHNGSMHFPGLYSLRFTEFSEVYGGQREPRSHQVIRTQDIEPYKQRVLRYAPANGGLPSKMGRSHSLISYLHRGVSLGEQVRLTVRRATERDKRKIKFTNPLSLRNSYRTKEWESKHLKSDFQVDQRVAFPTIERVV